MQMYKKSNRFVCTRNLFGCKEEQEAKCRAAEETERRVSTVKDATKPEKNANQQRDEQESKTGTSERKNSTTDREMWEIEWVFVKASNKASQGRKKAGGWTSETPTLHPKKKKHHIGNVPLNASPVVRRARPLTTSSAEASELLSDSMERLSAALTIIASSSCRATTKTSTERRRSDTQPPAGVARNNVKKRREALCCVPRCDRRLILRFY